MINKKRSGRAEGRLLEVLEKSPLETREPACQEFPACGGCMYQTMSYDEQLKMKAGQVKKLLDTAISSAGQVDAEGKPDYVFEGIYNCETPISYNKIEVENYRWVTREELIKDVHSNPYAYTSWFRIILNHYQIWD